jgi:hypothetical protein
VNPNQVNINYTLNLDQVNLIVTALGKLPFEQVEQFVVAFRSVAVKALQEAQEAAKAAEPDAVAAEGMVEAGAE